MMRTHVGGRELREDPGCRRGDPATTTTTSMTIERDIRRHRVRATAYNALTLLPA